MLDTLLTIVLQSWGLWRSVSDRSFSDGNMVGRVAEHMMEEEAAEILRVLINLSGRVETPNWVD